MNNTLKHNIMQTNFHCKTKKGRIKKGDYRTGRGYNGWHTTWDGKKVYLRSKLEFQYAMFLDKTKQYYNTERATYLINGKSYKPDFFIYENKEYKKLLKIVEIKGTKKEAEQYLQLYSEYFESIKITYEVFCNFRSIKEFCSKNDINNWIENYVINKEEINMAGDNNPMFGMKHSEETKKVIGAKTIRYLKNPEIAKKHKDGIKNFWNSEIGMLRRKEQSERAKAFIGNKNPNWKENKKNGKA